MYLRYVEQTKIAAPRRPVPSLARRALTMVLVILGGVAAYQIFAFVQEYLRAMGI